MIEYNTIILFLLLLTWLSACVHSNVIAVTKRGRFCYLVSTPSIVFDVAVGRPSTSFHSHRCSGWPSFNFLSQSSMLWLVNLQLPVTVIGVVVGHPSTSFHSPSMLWLAVLQLPFTVVDAVVGRPSTSFHSHRCCGWSSFNFLSQSSMLWLSLIHI